MASSVKIIIKDNILKLPQGTLAAEFGRLAQGEQLFGPVEQRVGKAGYAFRRWPLVAERTGDGKAAIIVLPHKAKLDDDGKACSTKPQQFFMPNINGQPMLVSAPKEVARNRDALLSLLALFVEGMPPMDGIVVDQGRRSGEVTFNYSSEDGLYVSRYRIYKEEVSRVARKMMAGAVGRNLRELEAFAKDMGVGWLEDAYLARESSRRE
ncbi:MAG: hypothetical protein NTX79_03380 [Candidatus Micrarchaeota archaeon]|nr:hypothetical protein [Candidatus Micrarchaeota archaeon]